MFWWIVSAFFPSNTPGQEGMSRDSPNWKLIDVLRWAREVAQSAPHIYIPQNLTAKKVQSNTVIYLHNFLLLLAFGKWRWPRGLKYAELIKPTLPQSLLLMVSRGTTGIITIMEMKPVPCEFRFFPCVFDRWDKNFGKILMSANWCLWAVRLNRHSIILRPLKRHSNIMVLGLVLLRRHWGTWLTNLGRCAALRHCCRWQHFARTRFPSQTTRFQGLLNNL